MLFGSGTKERGVLAMFLICGSTGSRQWMTGNEQQATSNKQWATYIRQSSGWCLLLALAIVGQHGCNHGSAMRFDFMRAEISKKWFGDSLASPCYFVSIVFVLLALSMLNHNLTPFSRFPHRIWRRGEEFGRHFFCLIYLKISSILRWISTLYVIL